MTNFMKSRDNILSYPTRPLKIGNRTVKEYIIPDDQKEQVLKDLYPFVPVPSLDEERYDLHEGKRFKVRDFRVIRQHGEDFLVSPYYPNSGGTVIDWMPPNFSDE